MADKTQRTAVVTGANRGIGFAIAGQLAKAGMRVIGTSRDAEKGKVAAQQLSEHGDVVFETLSVDDDASVRAFTKRVLNEYGRVDVLVNNAGVLIDRAFDTLAISPDLMREVFNINTLGPLMLAQAFMPGMLERNYGRIVNVSSRAGQVAEQTGNWAAYKTTKLALNGITIQLSHLAQGKDVLVNVMCPGWVRTELGGAEAPRTPDEGADTAVWLAQLPTGGTTGRFFTDRQEIPC
jgi:NAD(P)-dependent dehydrogenase (short-subunit alcohol dehydrogenase family)